jgi:hypothetical protein
LLLLKQWPEDRIVPLAYDESKQKGSLQTLRTRKKKKKGRRKEGDSDCEICCENRLM